MAPGDAGWERPADDRVVCPVGARDDQVEVEVGRRVTVAHRGEDGREQVGAEVDRRSPGGGLPGSVGDPCTTENPRPTANPKSSSRGVDQVTTSLTGRRPR